MSKEKKVQQKTGKNQIRVYGKVTHRIDGKVVKVERNAINVGLLAYFASSMDTNINKAILAAGLFDAAEVAPGGAQDANHGIAMYDATADAWLTLVTVAATATETHGRRWTGSVTVSQDRSVNQVAIGHSYEVGDPPFDTVFATQGFTALDLTNGKDYDVDWELYIA